MDAILIFSPVFGCVPFAIRSSLSSLDVRVGLWPGEARKQKKSRGRADPPTALA